MNKKTTCILIRYLSIKHLYLCRQRVVSCSLSGSVHNKRLLLSELS